MAKILIFLFLLIFSCFNVSADVISVNFQGGSEEMINPANPIEGFFLSELNLSESTENISSQQPTQPSGGSAIIYNIREKITDNFAFFMLLGLFLVVILLLLFIYNNVAIAKKLKNKENKEKKNES